MKIASSNPEQIGCEFLKGKTGADDAKEIWRQRKIKTLLNKHIFVSSKQLIIIWGFAVNPYANENLPGIMLNHSVWISINKKFMLQC